MVSKNETKQLKQLHTCREREPERKPNQVEKTQQQNTGRVPASAGRHHQGTSRTQHRTNNATEELSELYANQRHLSHADAGIKENQNASPTRENRNKEFMQNAIVK